MRFDETAKVQREKSEEMLEELKSELKGKYIFKIPNEPKLVELMRRIVRVTRNGTTVEQINILLDGTSHA